MKRQSIIMAGLLLFCSQIPVHSQWFNMDFELNPTYKWFFMQEWDTLSNSWGDTLMINHISKSLNGKPSEVIMKIDMDGESETRGKTVYTYEGDKASKIQIFLWIADSSKYSSTPASEITLTYRGDDLIKMTTESNPFESYSEFEIFPMDEFKNVKQIEELCFNVADGRILSDSTRTRTTGFTEAMVEEYGVYLEMMGIVADSSWVLTDKETYTYNNDVMIVISEEFDSENDEWVLYSKDSVLIHNDLITGDYSFIPSFSGAWELTGRSQYTYNSGDSLTQMVYQEYSDEEWVNSMRTIIMYTPYEESGVKPRIFATSAGSIKASLSSNRGSQMLNLTVDYPSEFSISLSDLSGRTAKRIAECTFSSGSYSIPLNISTPGRYFCRIETKDSRTVLPLTVLR